MRTSASHVRSAGIASRGVCGSRNCACTDVLRVSRGGRRWPSLVRRRVRRTPTVHPSGACVGCGGDEAAPCCHATALHGYLPLDYSPPPSSPQPAHL